jgi:hypothetical protein
MRARALTSAAATAVTVTAALALAPWNPATATAGAGACVPAPIHYGAPPSWSAAAWSESPGFKLPYALASGDSAAAFLWVRLRAGAPINPANKVLWVVRYPRHGHPLRILARDGATPALHTRSSWPADASPGEIYPSYLNLPKPGCWQLTLRWGSHTARLAVTVAPSGATSAL